MGKSVFRQREIEKLYELHFSDIYLGIRKVGREGNIKVKSNEDKIISDKEIGVFYGLPKLKEGEEFLLSDLNEIVVIKKAIRASDNSITYYLEDKVIETENTEKSYKNCIEEIKKHDEELYEKYNALKKEFDDYKEKFKFKHRFLNFTME